MPRFRSTIAAVSAAALLALAAGPAAAWEQQGGGADQGGGLRALPSGGLMLKDVPTTDSTVETLPGVRLNPQARDSGGTSCTQRRVASFDGPAGDYRSGTVSECSFGSFTFSTMRPDPQPWVPGMPTPFNN
ncbi:MAG: hypothetical protein J0H53_01200 [Rhizobiales bacterium]|jgi:hypothetical protein|nr:hypothetical protein [Hyphomicrobiales bacterium]OJU31497.1 MAG: hypothetical protein BGN94_06050 [Rhizobiales bacterium 68-8]